MLQKIPRAFITLRRDASAAYATKLDEYVCKHRFANPRFPCRAMLRRAGYFAIRLSEVRYYYTSNEVIIIVNDHHCLKLARL